jgi:SAM-dependent methyltransferase
MSRRERLIGKRDLATSFGVEIGALHAPTVRRDEGRIAYVDYATTDVLRERLRHPGVSPEDLVEVDIVWGEQPLAQALGEKADYAVAVHVIEHVPDLIGWLGELHAALKTGGTLGLVIPDRRYTFDACRNESGIAEVVAAHVERRRRPSAQQIFDVAALSAGAMHDQDWRVRDFVLPAQVLAALPELYRWIWSVAGPEAGYTDAHCWVFTPASFLGLAEALTAIGCFAYAIEAFDPTPVNGMEFLARLRALDPTDPDAAEVARQSIATAREALPVPRPPALPDDTRLIKLLRETDRLRTQMTALRGSLAWRLLAPLRIFGRGDYAPPAELGSLIVPPVGPPPEDMQMITLMCENDDLRNQIAAIRASRSWRLLAPLRAGARMLRLG